MNGTKEHEDGDEGRNGGPTVTVVAVTEDRRSQEIELLKQMRLKIAKLDPLSEVSTHARTHARFGTEIEHCHSKRRLQRRFQRFLQRS